MRAIQEANALNEGDAGNVNDVPLQLFFSLPSSHLINLDFSEKIASSIWLVNLCTVPFPMPKIVATSWSVAMCSSLYSTTRSCSSAGA